MVSDLKTSAHKGFKIAATEKVFKGFFLHMFTLFKRLFALTSKVQCPNFLDFWNPWGEKMERRGLRFENFCLKMGVESLRKIS